MLILDAIVEQRIAEACARGEFENLPGMGAPLELDDDTLVPAELRAAYRVLKNAGFLPPELAVHAEIREVEQMLPMLEDDAERRCMLARLNFLLSRSAASRRHGNLQIEDTYFAKIAARLNRSGHR